MIPIEPNLIEIFFQNGFQITSRFRFNGQRRQPFSISGVSILQSPCRHSSDRCRDCPLPRALERWAVLTTGPPSQMRHGRGSEQPSGHRTHPFRLLAVQGISIYPWWAFNRLRATTLTKISPPPIQKRQLVGSSKNRIPTRAVKITSLDMNTPPSQPRQ